jgi:6-phosphogluconolactonase (cycloisomerase 2 family)
MRNLPATLGALAIVLVGCNGNGSAAPIVRHAPFVLIVPYFSVVGDIRGSNSVSVYKVDPATGAVALAPGSPFASGKDPSADALAPGGRFAYVVNKSSNSVSAYKINSTTGALTRVAGSPFPVGDYNSSGPNGIVVDPTGKYAYVTSEVGVTAFSIDTTTGALVRVPGSPFAAARSNFGTAGIAVEPLGRFAYVLNTFDNSISVYSIERGALKRTGSPLDAGQNSNDPGAFASATVERFALT